MLNKTEKRSINVKNHILMCVEIFKTINNQNPSFLREIFQLRNKSHKPVRSKYTLNLDIPRVHSVRFGNKSLRSLAPKIWNSLPLNIKSATDIAKFKKYIKNWDFSTCDCCICLKNSLRVM